jgi:UDP-N-acetyl-D-glucosamine dehydrogenase
MKSVSLTPSNLGKYDCLLLATDHSEYDPEFIYKHASLIVDTRNMFRSKKNSKKVVKA